MKDEQGDDIGDCILDVLRPKRSRAPDVIQFAPAYNTITICPIRIGFAKRKVGAWGIYGCMG